MEKYLQDSALQEQDKLKCDNIRQLRRSIDIAWCSHSSQKGVNTLRDNTA